MNESTADQTVKEIRLLFNSCKNKVILIFLLCVEVHKHFFQIGVGDVYIREIELGNGIEKRFDVSAVKKINTFVDNLEILDAFDLRNSRNSFEDNPFCARMTEILNLVAGDKLAFADYRGVFAITSDFG